MVDADSLIDEIADDFVTYLQQGVRFDSFSRKIDPTLQVDGVEQLLRIHFLLTTTSDGEGLGVIDFLKVLPQRLRRVKTTVTRETETFQGEVRGRIDWQETVKQRTRSSYRDTLFACRQSKKNYNTTENLVLKELLATIHDIVSNDLRPAVERDSGYQWLNAWRTDDQDLHAEFEEVFFRNIYLQRVDVADVSVTDRMVRSVKNSRSPLYREAALLLERYRKLMRYELDPAEAKALLRNTFIKPDKPEVLFELYWVFQLLQQYEDVTFNVIDSSSNIVAEWEQNGYQYRIYHDATGSEELQFHERIDDLDLPNETDSYLARQAAVIETWQSLTAELLDYSGSDTLWGGRPDIILEQRTDDDDLELVFIGEVKYTSNRSYAAQGLKELLEYIAFLKTADTYLEDTDDLFTGNTITGILFTNTLETQPNTPPTDNITIVPYGETPAQPL